MSKVNNIILACENQDPILLIKNIDEVLVEKLSTTIFNKRKNISKSLLEAVTAHKEDTYEDYDPKIKEAIDYVVESVLESGLELENTIQMAAKQYSVKEEALTEYFDSLLETTKTETKVDSTASDDEDEKGGMRDDEDTNKRVRYESTTVQLSFEDGQIMDIQEDLWYNKIVPVLEQLNESNRNGFISYMKKDKAAFIKAVEFCQKVISE